MQVTWLLVSFACLRLKREREPVVDYSESTNCIVADFLAFFKTMYSGKHWRSRINKVV